MSDALKKRPSPHEYADMLRKGQRYDLLHELVTAVARQLDDAGLFRSCLNCDHWINDEDKRTELRETCDLYHARPPARIIITGCSSHSDTIPF